MGSAISSKVMSPSEAVCFARDGYVVKKSLFTSQEVDALNTTVNNDPVIAKAIYGRKDSEGATTELALWTELSEDMFGAVARSARIVDSLELVLGGEVAFFHSKLTLKKPKIGGAWDWHQDYGYWYRGGYLFPHMASVFIALDPSKKINGCLQVLKGSHHLGRLEHGVNRDQVGADMDRVQAAMGKLELIYVEMEPGDALFFHANLLHASGRNDSNKTRNVLLSCYNRADNPPLMNHSGNGHTFIKKLPDEHVMMYSDRPLDHSKNFHDGVKSEK
ncbi:MAG: phytanoyl-CoA dioxygenase family protein [Aestuariivita sp.]|nr:phytanoyl-CoA dioxygenase family protein [Aestuariivita sp.]